MNVPYIVELSAAEREQLQAMVSAGSCAVRKLKRAQVLLAAERGAGDAQVASMVGVGTSTVYRTKRRLVEEGLEAALSELPRPGAARKLTGQEDALLVAIACSAPPQGRARWTLELLADALVQCTEHSTLSRETVRRRLHEQQLKPWQKRMWCIQAIDGEYVARMDDVLELYTTPPEPGSAVVCFDETPVQLIGEARVPVPAQAGQPARIDYEYRRNGTANLFVFLDAHRPWRHVKVTERRTAHDFAQCMHDLLTVHYPDAQQVKVVLDNLPAHKPAALYEVFPAAQARALLRRLEFHFVPKHASWLNMVEIEIGVLVRQCLDRRIPDRGLLCVEKSVPGSTSATRRPAA